MFICWSKINGSSVNDSSMEAVPSKYGHTATIVFLGSSIFYKGRNVRGFFSMAGLIFAPPPKKNPISQKSSFPPPKKKKICRKIFIPTLIFQDFHTTKRTRKKGKCGMMRGSALKTRFADHNSERNGCGF